MARNRVIGRDGVLPWRIPSDLKRFKAITMGKPVIMGRKTWQSMPRRPLPGRLNIVVTHQPGYIAEGAVVAGTLAAAIAEADRSDTEEICVIGGGDIFAELMPQADRLYLSEVDLDVSGDTVFPPFDEHDWIEMSCEAPVKAPGDDASFILRVLDRRRFAAHH